MDSTLIFALLSVVQVIAILSLVFCFYMGYRNEKVYAIRTKVLQEAKAHYDQTQDETRIRWVFRALDAVTYKDMMWQFWVWPLDKFFRDVK